MRAIFERGNFLSLSNLNKQILHLDRNTDLFLQFIEQLLVELPLSKSLSLAQLLKMILQLLLLVVPVTRRVLLVGDHVADVVTQLRVDKHPVMEMVMI